MHSSDFIRKAIFWLTLTLCCICVPVQAQQERAVRLGIARMTHDHIAFILNRLKTDKKDLVLAGIFEPNKELVEKYSGSYHLDKALFYDNLDEMLEKVKPEAVVAFGSIFEHMAVVEACAPRGIHVMVEKPLAVNLEHAVKMKTLAEKYKIRLLTDFETSWYPTTVKSWQLVNDSNFTGQLRKVVVHDGHEGPVEIGCSREFLEWLTDPVMNGGGAIMDFGCYGANLITYLGKGQQPVSVTAVTRQFKPNVYPKVDDDATIIVNYPGFNCIIQASWNWPFGRKDWEIYGENGYILADDRNNMRLRNRTTGRELHTTVTTEQTGVYEDPFSYFIAVIQGKIKMTGYDPYSLENNMIVVKILDAARESAKTGETIRLNNYKD